jgi:hypothetical protein
MYERMPRHGAQSTTSKPMFLSKDLQFHKNTAIIIIIIIINKLLQFYKQLLT